MLSRRALYSLSQSERVALRNHWLRSGQCARCFHACIARRAEDEDNEQSASRSAPQRGPTRQQRAAMISEEVKMIQRDHPSPSFGESDPNTLRPPGASQTVDPEAVGENVTPGRMGQNDAATQEGPAAQGVGRVVGVDGEIPDTSKAARGTRSPHDGIEEPAEGGESVLAATSENSQSAQFAHSDEQVGAMEEPDKQDSRIQRTARVKRFGSSEVRLQSLEEMVSGRYSPSTISGGNFQRVVAERINAGVRQAPMQTQMTQPASKTAVREMVAGVWNDGYTLKKPREGLAALTEVTKTTMMNGTYMARNTEKLIQTIRSLLPAMPPRKAPERRTREVGNAP